MRRIRRDVACIVYRQFVRPSGAHVACNRRRSPRKNKFNIFPEAVQLPNIARPESLPKPDKQEQRTYPPRNTEHSEERAQLMCPKSAEGLSDDVESNAHGELPAEGYAPARVKVPV
jgi:hypothetical protein